MGAVAVADSSEIATHDVATPASLPRRQVRRQVAPSSFLAKPSGDNETKLGNGGYMKRPGSWNALFEGNRIDDTDLPKDLYMFWEQGHVQETAPSLNKMCFEKWAALNPSWNFHLVTSNPSAKSPEVSLTSLVPHLAELFQRIPRSVQLRSDMLRLEILAEYGGVWADASLLPLRGLDTFAKQLVTNSGFFVFTYPNTADPFVHYNATNDPGQTLISSWFIVSRPKNPLVVAWRDAFKTKWNESTQPFAYFEAHMTLKEMILNEDPRIIETWRSMPRISSWWPQLCLGGCSDYWLTSNSDDQPPLMKRPYQQIHDGPPSQWLQQWRSVIAV